MSAQTRPQTDGMSHIMDMNMSTDKGTGCWHVLALSKSCNKTWGEKKKKQATNILQHTAQPAIAILQCSQS